MSSKILTTHKDFFSNMAVDAVLRLKSSGNLEAIQITKVRGGKIYFLSIFDRLHLSNNEFINVFTNLEYVLGFLFRLAKGPPFKYYVIKDVGWVGWPNDDV